MLTASSRVMPRFEPMLATMGAALVVAAMALALLSGPPPVRAAEHSVDIADFAFSPNTLEVAVGDTVTWTNNDDVPHTATSTEGAAAEFDSGNLAPGATFSFTFEAAGDYPYFCEVHPEMTASITVVEAATGDDDGDEQEAPDTAIGGGTVPLGLIGVVLLALGGLAVVRRRMESE